MSMEWKQYELDEESIDQISEWVNAYCSPKMSWSEVTMACLTTEEILLNILEHTQESVLLEVGIGKRFGKTVLILRYNGEAFDPTDVNEDDWGSRILNALASAPAWSYRVRTNRVSVTLSERSGHGTMFYILVALIAAVLLGLIGKWLPESFRFGVDELLLTPVQDAFLGVLMTFAGLMIAFTICSGLLGMGDAATLRKVGKGLLIRILLVSVSASLFALALAMPFMHLREAGAAQMNVDQLKQISDMLFAILPSDPVTPFLTGNTLQIIVIATLIGIILLVLGERAKNLQTLVDEGAILLQRLMMGICRLIPLFVFVALLGQFWSGELDVLLSVWKPLLLDIVLIFVFQALMIVLTIVRTRCTLPVLIRKLVPPFLVGFTTASSISAFSIGMETGEKKMGIDPAFLKFAYPIGSVMHKPSTIITLVVYSLYFAQEYGVEVNFSWFILVVLTTVLLAIAVPPLPGAGMMLYGTIFAQLGIPADAVVLASLMELIVDYFCTGSDVSNLLTMLTRQACSIKRLDREILRKTDNESQ